MRGHRGRLVDINALVSLTNLERLDIKNTDFFAGTLPELISLHVTSCKIERLVLPPGLHSLVLAHTNFSEHATLANLVTNQGLQTLDVRGQTFESCIPSELGMVSTLVALTFVSSKIIGHIPTELGLLLRLINFNASCNQLSGPIPTELGNITTLRWLDLHANRLTGCLPKELVNCNLDTINVQGNNLESTIPKELVYIRYICI